MSCPEFEHYQESRTPNGREHLGKLHKVQIAISEHRIVSELRQAREETQRQESIRLRRINI